MSEEPTTLPQTEHQQQIHLVPPSFWPPLLAVGTTLSLVGIVIHPAVWIVGLVIVVVSLAGWFGELGRDLREAPSEPE